MEFQELELTASNEPIFAAQSGVPSKVVGYPRKILVIDENKEFCQKLRLSAQDFNALVVYCTSMAQFSKLVEVDRFDLVLVNKEFSNYKGAGISKFLSKFFKDLPIVMTSCREEGYDDNDPLAPGSVIGSIPRHFSAHKILQRIGSIYSERFQYMPPSEDEPIGYTNFCAVNQSSPVVKNLLATCGKVILANVSLVMKKDY